uniref:Uncharacterized protein n=1 Tax=Callorhinchus milii TaxID=7868 RepID=A0A4W3IGA5_CALMI
MRVHVCVAEIQCPPHSHYEACGTACPASCAHSTDPLFCALACVESCQCDSGYILSGGDCVPRHQCGCSFLGSYYRTGDQLVTDTCSRRCTCPGGGKASHFCWHTLEELRGVILPPYKSLIQPHLQYSVHLWSPLNRKYIAAIQTIQRGNITCNEHQECAIRHGVRDCHTIRTATCSASGDPHYRTFDGLPFDFQGTCRYTLSELCAPAADLTAFRVTVENERRGSTAVSWTRQVRVLVYGYQVQMTRGERGSVQVDGIRQNLPVTLASGNIRVHHSGSAAVLETDLGLRVSYDWSHYVTVTVPGTYMGSLCGLCGNFNGNVTDEFKSASGEMVSSPVLFGNSWKHGNESCPEEPELPSPQCTSEQRALYSSEQYCGALINATGPFQHCQSSMPSLSAFENCVFDLCASGEALSLCQALGAYALECQGRGIGISDWRNSTGCLECQENSDYQVCGTSCPASCSRPGFPADCGTPCQEGCQCLDGYVLSAGRCVPPAQCGCLHRGQYRTPGESFWEDEACRSLCVCEPGSGRVRCRADACQEHEACRVVNGRRRCVPSAAVCVATGDPHYRTFDGRRYDFQGACTYVLVTACRGARDAPQFRVETHNREIPGDTRVTPSLPHSLPHSHSTLPLLNSPPLPSLLPHLPSPHLPSTSSHLPSTCLLFPRFSLPSPLLFLSSAPIPSPYSPLSLTSSPLSLISPHISSLTSLHLPCPSTSLSLCICLHTLHLPSPSLPLKSPLPQLPFPSTPCTLICPHLPFPPLPSPSPQIPPHSPPPHLLSPLPHIPSTYPPPALPLISIPLTSPLSLLPSSPLPFTYPHPQLYLTSPNLPLTSPSPPLTLRSPSPPPSSPPLTASLCSPPLTLISPYPHLVSPQVRCSLQITVLSEVGQPEAASSGLGSEQVREVGSRLGMKGFENECNDLEVDPFSNENGVSPQVDGLYANLPWSRAEGGLTVFRAGLYTHVRTDFGLEVGYDLRHHVWVSLHRRFAGRTCGLCGNYNGLPADDYITPNGTLVSSLHAFASSWKANVTEQCEHGCQGGSCPVCEHPQTYSGSQFCGIISHANGPFAACLSRLDPAPYLQDCVYDVCLAQGDRETLCQSLQAFASACQALNVSLSPWRNDSFCVACPENSHYEVCGERDINRCGCFCDHGFRLSGEHCVPSTDCGCVHNGLYLQSVLNQACTERCQCHAGGAVECVPLLCNAGQECGIRNGQMGCHDTFSICVVTGDPHYFSYDGALTHFQGTCEYQVSAVCHNLTLPWFRITTENRNRGNSLVGGQPVSLPAFPSLGVSVLVRDGTVVVQVGDNLEVRYDGASTLLLRVAQSYAGTLCGLCGNFNGNPADDKLLPDGQPASNDTHLGNSWRAEGGSSHRESECTDPPPGHRHPLCDVLTADPGPFAQCHWQVDPRHYYTSCVFDTCAYGMDRLTLCRAVGAYAAACALHGFQVSSWRNATDFNGSAPTSPPSPTLSLSLSLSSTVTGTLPSGQGTYEGRMILYEDSRYSQQFSKSPIVLTLNARVYVGIAISGVDSDRFVLTMSNCWATPTTDPFNPIKWNLITNRCVNSVDGTVNMDEDGVSTVGRFSFNVFKFIEDSATIYLHCQVQLCDILTSQCSVHASSNKMYFSPGQSVSLRLRVCVSMCQPGSVCVSSAQCVCQPGNCVCQPGSVCVSSAQCVCQPGSVCVSPAQCGECMELTTRKGC